MIAEGELDVTKVEKPGILFYSIKIKGEKPKKVFEMKTGDYFGELALLNKTPRQATVTAKVSSMKNNFLD